MNSLVTIEEFDKAHLAQVAVIALEQAGIQCFLQNETIVAMDWFMANAVGGIQLQVASQDAEKARSVLAEIQESKNEREEARKDSWVAFRCSRCKKLIAFSGLSLGRVESCPKCGKFVDVPEQSDPSIEADSLRKTIEGAKCELKSNRSSIPTGLYLLGEIFLVLWIAYFADLLSAIRSFFDVFIYGISPVYSAEYVVTWLGFRSLYVLVCMAPILFLNGLPRKENAAQKAAWFSSLLLGVLLGGVCFAIEFPISYLVNERQYEATIVWPVWFSFTDSVSWYARFSLAIIANSVAEELVMRAYMIDRLERLFGRTWVAVLASALLFGSYHIYQGFITGFLGATVTGLLFGIYFARTRKLFPLVVAHTTFNFIHYAILWSDSWMPS